MSLESFLDDILVLGPFLFLVVFTSGLDALGAENLGFFKGSCTDVIDEPEEVLRVQHAIWRLLDVGEIGSFEFLREVGVVNQKCFLSKLINLSLLLR